MDITRGGYAEHSTTQRHRESAGHHITTAAVTTEAQAEETVTQDDV